MFKPKSYIYMCLYFQKKFYSLFVLLLIAATPIFSQDQQLEPIDTVHPAQWLAGSWGVTFPVFGGERLDEEVADGYDYRAGAQEIVDELPAVGHIICNLSYFAHSHYFTLRLNDNLDVAEEIHESLVPSLENEQIIFDVLKTFKDAGKKVILYISTNYFDRADDETHEAWVDYYTREFDGDEYAAYRFVVQGFISRIKDYADGYWLDTTNKLKSDGYLDDFYSMIRALDPDAAITGGGGNSTLRDENGEEIKTASNGFDDEDTVAHEIRIYVPEEEREDFTNGHVVGLQSGMLPTSWAYDEFTIPDMVAAPWVYYDTDSTLKHAWFPVRERWHSPKKELLAEVEQAYRFVKSITDAKAGITFATTTDYGVTKKGYMMSDEMAIMKEINNRLLMDPAPAYEPYFRPPGAYLVGEARAYAVLDSLNDWYHNYTPEESKATIKETVNGVLMTSVNTPYTQGNASRYVSKFTRESGEEAYIKFQLPVEISDPSLAIYKVRVYTAENSTLTHNDLKLSLRNNGNAATEISLNTDIKRLNDWVDYTFDMSSFIFSEESYNEVYLFFATEDVDNDAEGNVYYIDAFQGVSADLIDVKFIVTNEYDEVLTNTELSIDNRTIETNQLGEADIRLKKGEYVVNVFNPDYLDNSYTLDLNGDSTITLRLESTVGKVEFQIMEGNNYATSILVTLNGVNELSDDSGVVVFEDIEKGKTVFYSIKSKEWPEISASFILTKDTVIHIQLDASASLLEGNNQVVKVYPNPVKDILVLEMGDLVMEKWELFNMSGELIRFGSFKGDTRIYLSQFSTGVYLLKISNENQVLIKKIRKI